MWMCTVIMIYIKNVAYQLLAIPNSTQGLNGKTIAKSNLPDPGFNIDRMCSRISIGRSHLSSRLRQLMTSYFSCVSLNHSSVSNNLQSTIVSSSSSLSSILQQFYIHFEDKFFLFTTVLVKIRTNNLCICEHISDISQHLLDWCMEISVSQCSVVRQLLLSRQLTLRK